MALILEESAFCKRRRKIPFPTIPCLRRIPATVRSDSLGVGLVSRAAALGSVAPKPIPIAAARHLFGPQQPSLSKERSDAARAAFSPFGLVRKLASLDDMRADAFWMALRDALRAPQDTRTFVVATIIPRVLRRAEGPLRRTGPERNKAQVSLEGDFFTRSFNVIRRLARLTAQGTVARQGLAVVALGVEALGPFADDGLALGEFGLAERLALAGGLAGAAPIPE